MATQTEERGGAQAGHKLHREVSTIGLLFFSLGSILGSGWLFGSLLAAQTAGPAAIIAWVLGGLVMLVLALAHAELGGMYPVAGGSARYPQFSFGSPAGFAIGWIVWVGSVTVLYRAGGALLSEPHRLRRHRILPVRPRCRPRGGLQHRHLLLRHVGAPYARRGAEPCRRRARRGRGGRRHHALTLAGRPTTHSY